MHRIQKVKKEFAGKFTALLVSKTANITYLTDFNGFSSEEREAYLILTYNNNYILTDGRYSEVAGKLKDFKLAEISSDKNFENNLAEIIKKNKISKLAIDEDDIKVLEILKIKKLISVCSDENVIEKVRTVKEKEEIENIQAACALGDKTFELILNEIKLGVTEKEIAKLIEIFILENGAEISFRPIVAFGENSSSPHHVSGNRKLGKNEIVLLDFGTKINDYCSDMTRTVIFGKASAQQKRIYNTVFEAQQKAIAYLGTGRKAAIADKIAREYIQSQGFPTIPHSLGHGIGLEVHEKPSLSPNSKSTIENGMVFSIEPGIYLPRIGGVRIEDLVLMTKKGPLLISRANREIIEL